jgi:hypothetical protein
MFRRIVISAALLLPFLAAASLFADEFLSPVRPYDGIQAGLDAHAVGEARRLDAINRQLGWNQLFRWQAATQTSSSIYYNPYIGEYDYAFGLNAGYGGWAPSAFDFRPIWGYGYYEPFANQSDSGRYKPARIAGNRIRSTPTKLVPTIIDNVVEPVIDPAPVEPVAPAPPASPTRRGREF